MSDTHLDKCVSYWMDSPFPLFLGDLETLLLLDDDIPLSLIESCVDEVQFYFIFGDMFFPQYSFYIYKCENINVNVHENLISHYYYHFFPLIKLYKVHRV